MRYRKKRFARRLDKQRDYKPMGLPRRDLPITRIELDEFEAMRLCDIDGLSQIDAAEAMAVSRATIQRLLISGRKKLLSAILNHHAFHIDNSTEHISLRGENKMGIEQQNNKVIAFPTSNRQDVDGHFGHTKEFALYTINNNAIEAKTYVTPPPHEPGVLPQFLAEQGANVIITGGMGQRAINLFKQHNIDVILGAEGTIETNLKEYLGGMLESNGSGCDHSEHNHNHH